MRSWSEVVSIVSGLRAGRPVFDSRHGQKLLLFATASRPALGFTQPSIQWIPGFLSPGIKRPGRESEVRNAWNYTSTPPYIFMACYCIQYFIISLIHLSFHRLGIRESIIPFPLWDAEGEASACVSWHRWRGFD